MFRGLTEMKTTFFCDLNWSIRGRLVRFLYKWLFHRGFRCVWTQGIMRLYIRNEGASPLVRYENSGVQTFYFFSRSKQIPYWEKFRRKKNMAKVSGKKCTILVQTFKTALYRHNEAIHIKSMPSLEGFLIRWG